MISVPGEPDSATIHESSGEEFSAVAVPLDKRYSSLSMGLLFITMVAGFPAILVGFEWYRNGFTLMQVLLGTALSCAILLLYTVTASYLGASSGLHFGLLSRRTFGARGSRFISAVQSALFLFWYALLAVFMAEALHSLVLKQIRLDVLAFLCALLMSANNLFGFAGVANFARYIAAPCLIAWIIFVFTKVTLLTPSGVFQLHPQVGFLVALPTISTFIIGYSVWGNEADFWRFGKPRLGATTFTLILSVCCGQIIFPLCGWMLANISHVSEPGQAAAVVNAFSFGAHPWLALAVLSVCYFATADATLYGAVSAIMNLRPLRRKPLILGLTIVCGIAGVILSGCARAFEMLSVVNGILLPCASLIMAAEYFCLNRWLADSPSLRAAVTDGPALIALLLGWTVGLLCCGLFPGLQEFNRGIWPLYAWGTSIFSYSLMRFLQHYRVKREE